MKKVMNVPSLIVLCLAAAGFIVLAFFIGTWTGGSGKVSVTGAFVTVPEAITGTASNIEYKISVPDTDARLAGVTVDFSSTSRYISFDPSTGSVTTDADGLARIEIVAKPDAPSWARAAEIGVKFTIENVSISGKTARISIKAGE
ncbi:MAG: hypothetical protein ACE5LQ_06805 [Candidatus Bipolaricaulia bacterium]